MHDTPHLDADDTCACGCDECNDYTDPNDPKTLVCICEDCDETACPVHKED